MLNKIVELARQFKLQGQLSLEEYMACGIGICMGCSIETNKGKKLCCKYGPTVNLRDLV